jgi:phosphatidylglycerophosphatase A
LGVGLYLPAPGTFGAAIGSLLAWGISHLPGIGWQAAVIAVLFVAGIPLCTVAGRALGRGKDPGAIVWDELVTVQMVFLFVPLANWRVGVAGFALHRIFDITKPPPARQLEWLPEGLGVMADDVAAAVYAGATLYFLAWLDRTNVWGQFMVG